MISDDKNRTLNILINLGFTIFMLIMISLIFMVGQSKFTGMEPSLFGNRLYIVDSGSMLPALKIDSIILVKEKIPEEIDIGDIITYYGKDNSTRITHRVVEKIDNGEAFITRGDANNTEDSNPVRRDKLIGAVSYSVPYIGSALRFLSSTPGIVFIIAMGILSIIIPMIFRKMAGEA